MTPKLVLNISKLKSSRHIYLYQEVYLAKEGFTQMSWVISLDVCAFKYFHHEVINNIINIIILQLALKISLSSVTSVHSFIKSAMYNHKYHAQAEFKMNC